MDETEKNIILNKAVEVLQEGGVIIFPTDTVWGIGAALSRLDAIRRLYEIKGREASKPTAVLVANEAMAKSLGEIDGETEALMRRFWPGGLTMVVKAKPEVPKEIQAQDGTIGLRQPNHPLILKLIEKLGTGLVASSANFSGQPAPGTKELIDIQLINTVDLVLEGPPGGEASEAGGESPSTVLDTTVKPFKIIRQGKVIVK